MTEKELRKLNRYELLEMLLAQGKKLERLERELAEANERLAQRQQLLCDQYAQCCTRPDTHAGAYPKTYAGAGRQTSDGRRVPPDAVYRLHGGIRAGASTAGSVEQKSEA